MASINSQGPVRLAGRRGAGLGAAARPPHPGGGKRREGLPAVPVVAGPGSIISRRSSQTIPSTEGAHRLDLLIEEQKSAVKNAQSGLQQSLMILERATSKEERESAKMQVQSLLSRAEEFLLLLRVICEIRTELGHVQKELAEAKRNRVNAHPLYVRQQWLEVRLEKLLLAKRRSRPGARGQRTQVAAMKGHHQLQPQQQQQQQQNRLEDKRKSIGTLSTFSGPTKSISDSFGSFSDRDTTFSVRDSTIAPPSTAEAPVATFSSSSSSSASSSDEDSAEESERSADEDSVEESERSAERSDWASESARLKRAESQFDPEDSDAWHSESEANWTLVEASFRNGRDITQSQVLSEGMDINDSNEEVVTQRRPSVTFHEQSVIQQDIMLPPFSEKEEEEEEEDEFHSEQASTPGTRPSEVARGVASSSLPPPPPPPLPVTEEVVMQEYGFIPRRPVEIFGECSWNTLPLAIRSNLVQEKVKRRGSKYSRETSALMTTTGLDDFCTEIKVLNQLVYEAAHATTVAGRLVTTAKKTALSSHATKLKTAAAAAVQKTKSSTSITAPLPSIPNSPKNSRKLYGQMATYPRSSSTWNSSNKKNRPSEQDLDSSDDFSSFQKLSSIDLMASVRMRFRARSQMSRRSDRSRAATSIDIFDREMHKERCLQHLISKTESSLSEVRRSSVQALGSLPQISSMAVDKLQTALVSDAEAGVRYQALRSLLKLGAGDAGGKMTEHVKIFLSYGSLELQSDLLELLCQDKVLKVCLQKDSEEQKSMIDALEAVLGECVNCGEREDIKLYSAFLLSHAHLQRESCVQCLKCILQSFIPSHQSMALRCLLRCWECSQEHVLAAAFKQMAQLTDWKLRREAVVSLCAVAEGEDLPKFQGSVGQGVTEILSKRLVNEPVLVVRIAIGNLLKLMKVDSKVENSFLMELESKDEVTRSNAILALAGFELKGRRTITSLLDCVNFDPSMYIRIQVIRLLGEMKVHDPRVVEALKGKCRGQDAIANECISALQNIFKGIDRR